MEESVWKLLEVLARQSRSSVSDLIRQAVREKYVHTNGNRAEVFRSVAGLWRGRTDLPETATYVRRLRKGRRWTRMQR